MTQDSAVLDGRRGPSGTGDGSRTYSLVEVAQQTGIPMPILLRYKREHPDRVPSHGSGSQQRFPETAFEAFRAIQREEAEGHDEPRRTGFGLLSLPRLRKQASRPAEGGEPTEAKPEKRAGGRKRKAAGKASGESAGGVRLTLGDVSEQLDIPYPTVARYATQFGDRIPHTGSGRNRRFPPEALDVFRQIRKESKPGRPPKKKKERQAGSARRTRKAAPAARPEPKAAPAISGPSEQQLARRIESLERSQQILEDQLRNLLDRLSRPAVVTIQQV